MTEPAPEPAPQPAPDAWAATLDRLRSRFPGTRDGVLFCVHKLETSSPDLRLTDIRDEAALRGVPLSGRSLNSAKVLLGLAERPTRRTKPTVDAPAEAKRRAPTGARTPAARRATAPAGGSVTQALEAQLTEAMQQIQSAATAQSQQLRTAMREAIHVLQRALDEH